MNVWKSLSMAAIGSLLSASAAFAEGTPGEGLPLSENEVMTQSEMDDTVQTAALTDDSMVTESDVSEGLLLVGEVAAVDPESGQLILSTDAGIVSVFASPDDVQGVKIGDVIRVALFED